MYQFDAKGFGIFLLVRLDFKEGKIRVHAYGKQPYHCGCNRNICEMKGKKAPSASALFIRVHVHIFYFIKLIGGEKNNA